LRERISREVAERLHGFERGRVPSGLGVGHLPEVLVERSVRHRQRGMVGVACEPLACVFQIGGLAV
jgi:hypothetical protein